MEAGKTYSGEITDVTYTESQKGTMGLSLSIALAEEDVLHTMWITENTTERVAKTLAEFEIDPKNAEFWGSPKSFLVGKGCSVVTELKDDRVQIKWFNGPKRVAKTAPAGAAARAMALFGVEVPFA